MELNSELDRPFLRRFAVLTAAATFVLVCMGGLVTSHEAGLAVPDWPNSYGYNMFFFPVSKWIGGIFYEHTHRLAASAVGLMTTVLALWLFGRKSRPWLGWGGALFVLAGLVCCIEIPARLGEDLFLSAIGLAALTASFFWPACEPSPRRLRALGVLAFVAVVAQGVLGGLRVTELKDQLGIFHAALAQLFFLLVCALALFQTSFWRNLPIGAQGDTKGLRFFFLGTAGLILFQLVLGATMRHQHAGLAIPDFPTAYGKWWPKTDAASILRYNQQRIDIFGYHPITAFQIILQMVHRIVAGLILASVAIGAMVTGRQLGPTHPLSRGVFLWLGLIVLQVLLGAATIWTGKSADIATAHVACGALSLAAGGLMSMVAWRMLCAPVAQKVPVNQKAPGPWASASSTEC